MALPLRKDVVDAYWRGYALGYESGRRDASAEQLREQAEQAMRDLREILDRMDEEDKAA